MQIQAQTAQSAYDEIIEHIKRQGGLARDWYAGITCDVEQRLFGDHNVPRENHWFIVRKCYTEERARQVEQALLDYGCKGGGGGGDDSTVFVYAYLIGPSTIE